MSNADVEGSTPSGSKLFWSFGDREGGPCSFVAEMYELRAWFGVGWGFGFYVDVISGISNRL